MESPSNSADEHATTSKVWPAHVFARLRKHTRTLIPRFAGSSTEAALTRTVGGAFIVNILGIGVSFLLQILLARLLGVQDFGQYALVLTWISLLLLVAKLGLDTATLRFLPEYSAKGQWALLRGFERRSTQAALAMSLAMAGGVVAAVLMLNHRLEPGLAPAFYVGSLLLPAVTYLSLQGAHLQAFHQVIWSQTSQNLVRPLLLMAGLTLFGLILELPLSAARAMELSLIVTLLTIAGMALLKRRLLPYIFFQGERNYHDGMWTGVAIPMLFITSFNMILNQADIIMVGSLLSTREAGIYAAVSRIASLIPFAIVLVNTITSPLIAELYSQRRLHDMQRMMTRVAWGSMLVSAPLCLGIVVTAPYLLGLFGPDFISGSTSLAILAFSRLMIALTGSVGYLMSMTGHHKPAATILGVGAILNIVLDIILIPPFGIEGAAVASVITTTLWCIAMVLYAQRHIGINATVFPPLNPKRT